MGISSLPLILPSLSMWPEWATPMSVCEALINCTMLCYARNQQPNLEPTARHLLPLYIGTLGPKYLSI